MTSTDFAVDDPVEDRVAAMARGASKTQRVLAVDALRGFVMFTMIFVNDLAGNPVVPWWMQHYSESGRGPSGMTFVDLVFPAFLFLVGLSVPLALAGRLHRGVAVWRVATQVLIRAAALIMIGILMVNTEEQPNDAHMPFGHDVWNGMLYVFAILAFCQISGPANGRTRRITSYALRTIGGLGLLYLAWIYRWGDEARPIFTLRPLSVHQSWYGILGQIGWAYAIAATIFLAFRARRLPIVVCIALLYTLFALDKDRAFEPFRWLDFVSVGQIATHGAIATSGLLLGTTLFTADTATPGGRLRSASWFVIGFAAAAFLVATPFGTSKDVSPLWMLSKNDATPGWGLASAAAAGAMWMAFYVVSDVRRVGWIATPWARAGQNVLLAYLLSEGLVPLLHVTHLADRYIALGEPDLLHAVCRSIACALSILAITAGVNRLGFFVRL